MAKDLKTGVRIDTRSAEKNLDRLMKKINRVQNAFNQATTTNNRVESAVRRVGTAQDQVTKAVNKTNAAHKKTSSLVSGLTTKVKRLAATYLGVMGLQAALTTSDTITAAENKLNHLNNGDTTATQQQLDQMYASSQKVRMGYADMMSNVSKSMTLASDAFQGNMDNAIRFQEIMGEAYTIGGASAAEMSSSMYQMIQGLGSGILQGDELRSVREGAPLAYKAIEEFAQGIFGAEENLKDLASQGKITSDIVVAAIMAAGDEMDAAFKKTDMTFAQAWTNIKNTAIKSFEPVLQKLNDLLNSPIGQSITSGIGTAIQIVAGAFLWLFNLIESIYNFFATHWPLISKILWTIAVIIAAALIPKFIAWISYLIFVAHYYIVVGIMAISSAVAAAAAWLAANWPLLLVIAILAAIVIALIWVADSFADACGIIVGVVYAAGAIIWNIVSGIINGIIQFLWTNFVEPWIGIIEWVLNVFNGGFNSFGDGVKNLLGQIISWFLSLGKVVTKIIDAIFGTNWTGGLESLQSSVLSWGKNEQAITLSREAPTVMERKSVTGAYSAGYDVGFSGGQWITDKVSGIGDKISGALNIGNLPSGEDYDLATGTGAFDPAEALKGIGDTADNTGKMADSMQLAEEDLAYLRDVANMEWKKEFTTAEIKVDMSNYNTVNGDSDLDGIVTRLTDKLYEELEYVANGVYA